jgi:hypothetical protein
MQAVDVVDSKPKRWKGEKGEDDKAKAERSCSDNSGEDSGSPRAHKESTGSHKNHKDLSKQDYIHVRARRGQATDSHSLAERTVDVVDSRPRCVEVLLLRVRRWRYEWLGRRSGGRKFQLPKPIHENFFL